MIQRDKGGVYFLAGDGYKLSTVLNDGAAYGVGVYSDLEGQAVLTISKTPFSFHEHLSASECRQLGEALIAAAEELEKTAETNV